MNVKPQTEQEYVAAIKHCLAETNPKRALHQMEKVKPPPTKSTISQLIYQAIPSLEWEAENTHDSLTGHRLDKALQKDAETAMSKIKMYVKDFENNIHYQKEYRLAATYGWLKDNDYQHKILYRAITATADAQTNKQLVLWQKETPRYISEDGKEWELELVAAQMRIVDNRGKVIRDWATIATK